MEIAALFISVAKYFGFVKNFQLQIISAANWSLAFVCNSAAAETVRRL